MSEIKVNSVVNSTGDNDSGLDLSTNDQVIIKTANTTAITVDSSQNVTNAGDLTVSGAFTSQGIDDNADATAITIDSSENVGIGETSPLGHLHIKSEDTGVSSVSAQGDLLVLEGSETGLSILNSTTGAGYINFGDSDDNNIGMIIYDHSANALKLFTNASERLNIDSSGNLRVQQVYTNITSGGANVRVQSDGLMQRDTSSQRYKNTINDATHGLTELLTLRPVTYKGNNDGDIIFGGLIAEEVHDAGLTEFVEYDEENRPDALRYSNMVSLCIKAIQELSSKVTTLETEKAELEARITALENT